MVALNVLFEASSVPIERISFNIANKAFIIHIVQCLGSLVSQLYL